SVVDQCGNGVALRGPEQFHGDDFHKILARICNLLVHNIDPYFINQDGTGISIGITIIDDRIYADIDLIVVVLVFVPNVVVKVVPSIQKHVFSAQLNGSGKITGTQVIQQKVGGTRKSESTTIKIIDTRVIGDFCGIDFAPVGGIGKVLDDIGAGIHKIKAVLRYLDPHSYYGNRISFFYQTIRDGEQNCSCGRVVGIGHPRRHYNTAFIKGHIDGQYVPDGVAHGIIIAHILKREHIIQVLPEVHSLSSDVIPCNIFNRFGKIYLGFDDLHVQRGKE